ncbi:MAG TPA: TadE/TadG family type IV pilus assembly protein [Sphingomicrobium sp.]|nr:TadE/TadG family type IV pilus assembly protein [Sphingomicrobium sp.]
MRLTSLRRNEDGAAAVEMALAVPILLSLIYGIFQIGVIMSASAGMQHALGEGARYATIFPTPSDAQIVTRMQNKVFGMNIGTFSTPTVATPATTVCTNCRLLTVSYTVTPNFLFFNAPPVTLTRTKQVYLSF